MRICWGVGRLSWVPSPSWPKRLSPQVHRVLSVRMAAVAPTPAATVVTPSITWAGVGRLV